MLKVREICGSASTMLRERRVLACAGGVLVAAVLVIVFCVYTARLGSRHGSLTSVGDFRRIIETSANDGRMPVIVFESNKTGLRIAFGRIDGPIVSGAITLGN